MGLHAAVRYLRSLRELQHIGRGKLALCLSVDHSQIERIEKGKTDTRGSLLLAMLHELNGSADDLVALMVSPTATEEDAQARAAQWLTAGRARPGAAVGEIAAALSGDPARLHQWIGYGQRLIDELEGGDLKERP